LLTRFPSRAGIVLVFGATSIEHFNVIGEQLVHTIFLAAVVGFTSHNKYSVDHLLPGRVTERLGWAAKRQSS
jgi:hypothetical protein